MIDAKELRIGVSVEYLYPHEEEWGELVVTKHEIFDFEDNKESFRGIPLTEEWLIKFGFENVEDIWWKRKGFYYQVLFSHGTADINKRKYLIRNISKVHSLQNLYFALTGEELTIKE